MSRGCTGRESDGSGRGTYAPPIPLLVEKRGSYTSGMNDTLEVKVCEGCQPINQLETPSYQEYVALRNEIKLYLLAIKDGDKGAISKMKEKIECTFEEIKSRMDKGTYGESFFSTLQKIYEKLAKSRESSSEIVLL